MVKHFQDDPNPPPFIKSLAELRHLATREGWCYQHVQACHSACNSDPSTANWINGLTRRSASAPRADSQMVLTCIWTTLLV